MTTITQGETAQIEKANANGRPPVVFVHGLWLLPSSWQRWMDLFEEAGYAPLAPGWPDDPETVEAARANPEAFASKGVVQVADHFAEAIGGLDRKPTIVGHSFGGLIAQILAGRGLSVATVAVNPAPFKGVLPLPLAAIRTTLPVLGNPLNRGRAVTLSFDQFRYGWANAVAEDEARRALRRVPRRRARQADLPGGVRQLQPRRRDQGRHQEPRARAALDLHRRGRPRGAAGDEQGRLQEAEP